MLGYLVECAVRTLFYAGVVAVLLRLMQVRETRLRLAAWRSVLWAGLLMPVAVLVLPSVALVTVAATAAAPVPAGTASPAAAAQGSPWWMIYGGVAMVLVMRLLIGLWIAERAKRRARVVEELRGDGGCVVLESSGCKVPVTIGWLRPAILLPDDWRSWDAARLEAVLAHERAHVASGDFAVRLLSAVHRAWFWFSPLSWWLHRHLEGLAEQACDEAALRATGDAVAYAETLQHFFERCRRGERRLAGAAIGMARGDAGRRVEEVLRFDPQSDRIVSGGKRMAWRLSLVVLFGIVAAMALVGQAPPAPPAPPAPEVEVAPEVLPPPPAAPRPAPEVEAAPKLVPPPAPPAPAHPPPTPRPAPKAAPAPPVPPAPPKVTPSSDAAKPRQEVVERLREVEEVLRQHEAAVEAFRAEQERRYRVLQELRTNLEMLVQRAAELQRKSRDEATTPPQPPPPNN